MRVSSVDVHERQQLRHYLQTQQGNIIPMRWTLLPAACSVQLAEVIVKTIGTCYVGILFNPVYCDVYRLDVTRCAQRPLLSTSLNAGATMVESGISECLGLSAVCQDSHNMHIRDQWC